MITMDKYLLCVSHIIHHIQIHPSGLMDIWQLPDSSVNKLKPKVTLDTDTSARSYSTVSKH